MGEVQSGTCGSGDVPRQADSPANCGTVWSPKFPPFTKETYLRCRPRIWWIPGHWPISLQWVRIVPSGIERYLDQLQCNRCKNLL